MNLISRLFGRGSLTTAVSDDKTEKREQSFTDLAMGVRYDAIKGTRGIAELTATAQGCISLWESGLSLAETDEPLLTPEHLALTARGLGLRGEALFVIRGDRLVPVSEFDVTTRGGIPTAYRVTIPDTGGGRSDTVLAAEVLHFKIGADVHSPWRGTAPLKRASLTAGLLHAVEDALAETFESAPLGSLIAPMPENPDVDNTSLARSFRGQRGRVLLRESVNVTAAGGPSPVTDWKPSDLSPDLSRAMTAETLSAARDAISQAFGVLPALNDPAAAGPVVREAQRHLAQWMLQPIAAGIAQECTAKLGDRVSIDVMKPLQAYDAGGRARALTGVVEAMAAAKAAGLSETETQTALDFSGVQGS
ncbi:phage portal protein [Wenzhouxiangella sp. EGI_FJ10305]|uniref:phage portal protein n=1 Tax=Wenzhouxiangella sp. EGI_FJ10305 TaxID=3243768 RepID=UPI0035DA621D